MHRADELLYAFRTNVVVTASAGTGKTFRLVALYVLLTLGLTSKGERDEDSPAPPLLPPRIAATTFSRAAAAEIRERVERVLLAVASARYDASTEPYREIFEARARKTASPDLLSRAMRERAQAALDAFPHAFIDTLHGLAGRVVRASAFELGMTPSFGILDEDEARASVDASTEEVLSVALSRANRGAVDLLDAGGGLAMTRRRIAELLDRADEEGLRIEELDLTDFATAANDAMCRLRDLCDGLCAERSRTLAEPAALARVAVSQWLERGASEKELADALEPLFTRRSPARPVPAEEAFLAFRDAVKGDTHSARARRFSAFVSAAAELTPRTQAMARLLSEIADSRSSERRRAGKVGFGDLLRAARDTLRDDPATAVAAGSLFDVLLVDEFQDTSRVQRDLIYLLREKRDSATARRPGALPAAGDLAPAGLLVVGDRKQSIYGFRGADVTVFGRVSVELAGARARDALRLGDDYQVPADANAALVTLSESRRSDPALLRFVNWFAMDDFGETSGYPFDIRYAESEHLTPAEPVAPVADHDPRVVIVDDRGETSDDLPPLVRGAAGPMREALLAAAVVDRAVRGAKFGRLGHGDFAILARRRATLSLLEFALARLDIPHVVAGRGLFETREIRDLFGILRLILDPYDRHALATVLRGPAVGLGDRALALLSQPGRGLLPPDAWFEGTDRIAQSLSEDDRERLGRFATKLWELRRIGLALGPADAIRLSIEKLDLDRVMAALPRAAQRLGNVERLIDLATRRGGSLAQFTRWLDQQIADERDESEAAALHDSENAVTLMTIHASKGLEFRAVVLVDTGGAVRAPPLTLALAPATTARPARLVARHTHALGGSLYTPEAAEFSKEARAREVAERRRITYVAMTRAKERLFLLVPPLAPNESAAATLRRLIPHLDRCAGTVTEPALPYLIAHPPLPEKKELARFQTPPFEASRPDQRFLAISTTPLSTFDECPRRYRLIHELDLEPPPTATPPGISQRLQGRFPAGRGAERALGTAAHRVLERWPFERWGEPTRRADVLCELAAAGAPPESANLERIADHMADFLGGPYAAEIRATARAVYREEPFVLQIPADDGSLSLRGTIDLLVTLPDGSAQVVDYKTSWQTDTSASAHELQLRSYALAARLRFGAVSVRTAILNLASSSQPTWSPLHATEISAFGERLSDLRRRFLVSRANGAFPGVARPECLSLRCGFVGGCHPA